MANEQKQDVKSDKQAQDPTPAPTPEPTPVPEASPPAPDATSAQPPRVVQPAPPSPYIWVMSNRVDNRVVLFERDPAHPNGEAFVGGDGVAVVGRTTRVVTLLREGLLVEVPEPPAGPKKPLMTPAVADPIPADQPGQPIALGRKPDPELFGDKVGQVAQAQERLPEEVPVPAGVVVPPAPEPARESRRR